MNKKIAICVSGQTRGIVEHGDKFLDTLHDLFGNHEYDLFGHTWDDQDDPLPDVLNRFTSYKKQPQSEMWDAVLSVCSDESGHRLEPSDFVSWRDYFWDRPEYVDMMNGKGDLDLLEFMQQNVYGAMGQLWSAHECMLSATSDIGHDKYDIVIRLRWDASILQPYWLDSPSHEVLAEVHNGYVHDFRSTLDKCIRATRSGIETDRLNNRRINEGDVFITLESVVINAKGAFFNDFIFVMKNSSLLGSGVSAHSTRDLMRKIAVRMKYHQVVSEPMPASHTLWMEYFQEYQLHLVPILPDVVQRLGDKAQSFNTKWDI